jgi:hypothetical protein
MPDKEPEVESPSTPNQRLLMAALDYLRRAEQTTDPARKTKMLENAHRLQKLAQLGILEDLRRTGLVAKHTATRGDDN